MTATIEAIRADQLADLKRAILKHGPLTWEQARLAMFRGSYDRRDARFHNETIMGWISEGKLTLTYLDNGDCLIEW